MSVPTSRDEFKQYCLRALGHPVIEINVSQDQIDDRVDEALRYYWDYHFDGSERTYYKHQITATDRANKYITVPENIIGAVRVFPVSDPMVRADDLFNIRYQIALNDLYTLTSVSMIPYYMVLQHLNLITELLVGQQPIRFSRHKNKVYLDMDWDKLKDGEFVIIEAFEVIDPDVYTNVWGDRWLQNYCIAKIKYQWGSNLDKYRGMSLPGGVQFNGASLKAEADADIKLMEREMITNYAVPVIDLVG